MIGYCICECPTYKHERIDEKTSRCTGCGFCTRSWDHTNHQIVTLDKVVTDA